MRFYFRTIGPLCPPIFIKIHRNLYPTPNPGGKPNMYIEIYIRMIYESGPHAHACLMTKDTRVRVSLLTMSEFYRFFAVKFSVLLKWNSAFFIFVKKRVVIAKVEIPGTKVR